MKDLPMFILALTILVFIAVVCWITNENIKRIEAVTRENAYIWFTKHINVLMQISDTLKTPPENIISSVNKLRKQLQDTEKKLESILEKASIDIPSTLKKNKRKIQIKDRTIDVIAGRVDGINIEHLGKIADGLVDNNKNIVVFIAGVVDGKIALTCKVTPDISHLIPASKLIKYVAKILNGSGGGKPEFAQGSGKDITKIDEVISQIYDIIPDIPSK